jgi:ATP-dependent Clp protease ATP-binding subunit ClpA
MQKGVKFSYSDEVLDFIVNKAESKKSGARELRHMIRKHVEDKIAVLVVNSANDLPLEIFIDVKDNEIVLIEK